MTLTPDQLATIDRQLRHKRVLQNETLLAELTDHFVSAIVVRMAAGESFDDAGAGVMATFGGWQGLARLQKEYVRTQNRMAWATVGRVVLKYLTTPRLLLTLCLLAGTYLLLSTNWKPAFYGLWLVTVALYVLVGFGMGGRQKWSWKSLMKSLDQLDEQPAKTICTKQAGMRWVIGIVIIVAFNIPCYQYLFFFPLTFDRPFDSVFPVSAAIGFTSSYVGFLCLIELTYRQNRWLNWLARS